MINRFKALNTHYLKLFFWNECHTKCKFNMTYKSRVCLLKHSRWSSMCNAIPYQIDLLIKISTFDTFFISISLLLSHNLMHSSNKKDENIIIIIIKFTLNHSVHNLHIQKSIKQTPTMQTIIYKWKNARYLHSERERNTRIYTAIWFQCKIVLIWINNSHLYTHTQKAIRFWQHQKLNYIVLVVASVCVSLSLSGCV